MPGHHRAADSEGAGLVSQASGDGEMLLRLRGIGKNFGPVQALTDVTLDFPAGQVTALVGDNGAGKSTLIKVVAGIWEPSHGEIIWQGKPVRFRSPKDATDAGIATVYQDLALCDNLDIVENMMLGRVTQTELVLGLIRHLADQGICVIMISHNLTDVFTVAARIAILYLGRLVTVGPLADFDTATAVHWMTVGTSPNGQAGQYGSENVSPLSTGA